MTDKPESHPPAWAEPSPVEHGGRVELRLVEQGDGTTRYAARWYTAHDQMEGEVAIAEATSPPEKGAPSLSVTVDSPSGLPEWLGSFTTSLVRTTARRAQKEGTWPRRLTRWRKAPDEEGK